MTNINCNKTCIYQKEGKCCYDSVLPLSSSVSQEDADCAYCVAKKSPKDKLISNET